MIRRNVPAVTPAQSVLCRLRFPGARRRSEGLPQNWPGRQQYCCIIRDLSPRGPEQQLHGHEEKKGAYDFTKVLLRDLVHYAFGDPGAEK